MKAQGRIPIFRTITTRIAFWRCCINQKDSLIINYLQFESTLIKFLLINNLAVFMPQRLAFYKGFIKNRKQNFLASRQF